MNKMLAFVLVALLARTSPALAQEIVLTAIPGRTGSISKTGLDVAVYLRWDITEGAFPVDLVRFELFRNGTKIATLPYAVADATTIEAAYALPANDRRERELYAWLAAELDPEGVGDQASFPEWVFDKLTSDTYWTYFASRIDPTLAGLLGLGYVDVGVAVSGVLDYRLDGVLWAGTGLPERTVKLGFAQVNAGVAWSAPAAATFAQIAPDDFRRCDAPEAMKAHGVVALDWGMPGVGAPERFGVAQAIAGWDLYRTSAPLGGSAVAPPRDLAAQAAALTHDAAGHVHFAGLTQVNDQPILGSADLPPVEPGYQSWAPASARYLATLSETLAQGMRPGERYAYYLVARDVTGNYGATLATIVDLPDLLAPPTPWNVRTTRRVAVRDITGVTPDTMIIRWPQVDLLNFVEDHARRTYCNLEDAKFTRELSFVDAPSCPAPSEGTPVSVSLRVDHYDIYRFASAAEASGFTDADGDGVADRAERNAVGDPLATPGFSTPGTACDPLQVPLGSTSYKVDTVPSSEATTGGDGRYRLEWSGTVGPEDAGKVFWYRIVAVAEGGARSPMSAPVRAVMPAYRKTAKRAFDPPETCVESIELFPCTGGDTAAIDTTGDAALVRYSCGTDTWDFPLAPGGLPGQLESVPWANGQCGDNGTMTMPCLGDTVHVEFFDGDGNLIQSTTLPNYNGTACVCARLSEECVDPPFTVLPGSFDPVPYDPDSECLAVYRRIGSRLQRIEVICDTLVTDFSDYYSADLLGGTICLYTAVQGPNGAITPKFPLGCEEVPEAAAEEPQVAGLSFPGSTTALLRIIPPEQPVLGFVAEVRRADGSQRVSTFVQLGALGALGDVSKSIDIGAAPPAGVVEEWCLRARTVISRTAALVITDSLSDWSPDVCAFRMTHGTPAPTYLPWPALPTPPEGVPLDALYLDGDGLPIVHLASYDPCAGTSLGPVPICDGKPEGAGDEIPACYQPILALEDGECRGSCERLDAALAGTLGFVAYRQSRPDQTSTPSDFVQISPLIDRAHCEGVTEDELPPGFFWYPSFGDELDLLADPYIAFAYFKDTDDGATVEPWKGIELYFIDRYPHSDDSGIQYRYQFVWFDARGEPASFRTSNWIKAER